MHRPRRVQHCHWFLWRYGRLRDDRSVDDQREIRRSYPVAGIAAALFLLLLSCWPALIEQIPLAALVGVMFMVVIGTFAWNSLTILRKVPKMDAFVIFLVTLLRCGQTLHVPLWLV